jgi:pimeloyl-ACP methyl ester carboxylesterase
MAIAPYRVDWSPAAITQVLDDLRRVDLPPAPAGSGWELGCDAEYLSELREYWLNEFEWDAAQAVLNQFPQFITEIDGIDIHFVHVRGESKTPRPLLLSHGWPGSHFEFWEVIEPLAFPSRFGGNAEDAFDLVVPSLPGFGLSGKPPQPIGQRETAKMWNSLMTDILGYPKYLAQGGDWGGIVTSWLGLDHGKHVTAIHLNLVAFNAPVAPQSDAEAAWMREAGTAQKLLSGYSHLQMTKPQSIAWASAGNPLGQAAWIIERFHDWSDLGVRRFEDVYSRDFLIINALLYIMTGSFVSAAWYYKGFERDGGLMLAAGTRCETPTAVAAFPGDALLPVPPRSRAELAYNVTRWTDMPSGGHFAASEEPALFVEDVRGWARDVWPTA